MLHKTIFETLKPKLTCTKCPEERSAFIRRRVRRDRERARYGKLVESHGCLVVMVRGLDQYELEMEFRTGDRYAQQFGTCSFGAALVRVLKDPTNVEPRSTCVF